MKKTKQISKIFSSATAKLTIWYLVIIMVLSVIFSITLYRIAVDDLETKVQNFQTELQNNDDNISNRVWLTHIIKDSAKIKIFDSLIVNLLTLNITILMIGGVFSYVLARYSINPLQKVHEKQSRFTSDASHELRTPLAAMRTELEVALSDNKSTKSEMRNVLISNLEEVKRLTDLSEMLLNLSKIDEVKFDVNPIDVIKVIKVIIKEKKQYNSRFLVTAPKKLMICANETAIGDLFRILIENAIQYSPVDSNIKIVIKKSSNKIRFTINNIGKGIKPADIQYIFDRFYRADTSRSHNNINSYGLGLSLAKNIVDVHHGEISVRSKINKYTEFIIELPIDQV